MPRSEISKALENDRFVVSLMHLQLRRESQKYYREVGERKVEIELQGNSNLLCSLEGGKLISKVC